jgi:hypothetical protein
MAENLFTQIALKVSGKANNKIAPTEAEQAGKYANNADQECKVE